MNFDKVYSVKKEDSKEDFLRLVMMRLSSDITTPVDVLDADFGEVRESVKEVLLCSAHVESDYTVSIGYDREEEYHSTSRQRLMAGDWYTCNGVQRQAKADGSYEVDTIRKRTVTDWHPDSGHFSGNGVGVAMNGSEALPYTPARFIDGIDSIEKESIIEEGDAVVSSGGMDVAKENCRKRVESEIAFPGDHYKDFDSRATVDVEKVECYRLPFYEVEYTYKGKKYTASNYACGTFPLDCECPPNDADVLKTATDNIKPYRIARNVGWTFFGMLFVLGCVLLGTKICSELSAFALFSVPLIIAITVHIISNKKHLAQVRALTQDSVIEKRKKLEKVFCARGYRKLSDIEAKVLFDVDNKETSCKYPYWRKRWEVIIPSLVGCFAVSCPFALSTDGMSLAWIAFLPFVGVFAFIIHMLKQVFG